MRWFNFKLRSGLDRLGATELFHPSRKSSFLLVSSSSFCSCHRERQRPKQFAVFAICDCGGGSSQVRRRRQQGGDWRHRGGNREDAGFVLERPSSKQLEETSGVAVWARMGDVGEAQGTGRDAVREGDGILRIVRNERRAEVTLCTRAVASCGQSL
ncbi:hypothetical protein U1Q18_029775 [Sarracenia purpurea var. burkii]